MENARKKVNIYTVGTCAGNAGPGGWAVVLEYGGHRKELNGFMAGTTADRMALFAIISALGALKEPCNVDIFTASDYVVNAFSEGRIEFWRNNGWKTAVGESVANQDLWFILTVQTKKHHAAFILVNDTAVYPDMARCAELAEESVGEYRRINGEEKKDP